METLQSNLNSGKYTRTNGHINIENPGFITIADFYIDLQSISSKMIQQIKIQP